MSDSTSVTWSAHVRILFAVYNLPDPLTLLNSQPWPKERWKLFTQTAVTAYHEKTWREKAATNSKLGFFNVQVSGLAGRPHPVLTGILTTRDVMCSRIHIKMLSGDYPCFSYLGSDRKQDAYCRLCQFLSPHRCAPDEDMVHVLTMCKATSDTRTRIIFDLLNTIAKHFPRNNILDCTNHQHLSQLILDPTSLNLPTSIRISPDHPDLLKVLSVCRTLCFAINKDRTRQLKILGIGYS